MDVADYFDFSSTWDEFEGATREDGDEEWEDVDENDDNASINSR
jgi:hypothetical protein